MWTPDLGPEDVTPRAAWMNRRQLFQAGAAALAASAAGGAAAARELDLAALAEGLEPTSLDDIRSYCNFYEFGTGKNDPARHAGAMVTEPWPIRVEGAVERPGVYDLRELVADIPTEERIYRLRCVEAWSMVIPWNGFELNRLLDRIGVRREARYVAFETVMQPENMPGLAVPIIDWPYREGLRLDEAMHPLTMLATGLYGEPLANQNGAPVRLVVPWKYGFKSIKSIDRIVLTEDEPPTSWNMYGPNEYGFYANVNPEVDHPRWSQAEERVIGTGGFGGLLARRQPTLMFNGYAEHVAPLYEGMDLRVHY
jgi:sulfoxide reductase catalytic subunit YedY